ncbi:MAG: hypothetical protein LBH61_03455 [Dysgonamonadaceae bacterium]|jgi:hypothetical protein|nr:hypothetical protein [Dysgonamonadaceae bacterium]
MGAFFIFLLILILVIVFVAVSLVGSILGGILKFLGFGSNRRGDASGRNFSGQNPEQPPHQSQEGAKRMRKFKNTAEDADFETINN